MVFSNQNTLCEIRRLDGVKMTIQYFSSILYITPLVISVANQEVSQPLKINLCIIIRKTEEVIKTCKGNIDHMTCDMDIVISYDKLNYYCHYLKGRNFRGFLKTAKLNSRENFQNWTLIN